MQGSRRSRSASCSARHSCRVAGQHARGLETLADFQHGFDILDIRAKGPGDVVNIAAHEASLVGFFDQAGCNQAVGFGEGGDGEFRALLARSRTRPVKLRGGPALGACFGRLGGAVGLVDIVGTGVEFTAGLGGAAGFVEPHLLALFRDLFRRLGRFWPALAFGPGQKRIPLDLGLDIVLQFDVGELEQLDRLLQLRRHDKGLPLPQLKTMRERHYDLPGRRLEPLPRSDFRDE
jgi:hypothetical protein